MSFSHQSGCRFGRSGFTLFEAIVSASSMLLLLGVAAPLLQDSKEEFNRVKCLNNLQMISIASIQYDEVEMMLPPYMGVPNDVDNCDDVFDQGRNYQLTYSLTQLLGFLGYMDLVDQTDSFAFSNANMTIQEAGYPTFSTWVFGIDDAMPGIRSIAIDVVLDELLCPSDPADPSTIKNVLYGIHPGGQGAGGGNSCTYFWRNTGPDWNDSSEPLNRYSITNYVASMGRYAMVPPNAGAGAIQSRYALALDEIPDGASNVVIFGESLGTINSPLGNFGGINGARFSMALGGLAVGNPFTANLFGDTKCSRYNQFGSGHAEVVNTARGDGSTFSVDRDVSWEVFGLLCGIDDGNP